MFYQPYGMELRKYEKSIKYFENPIKIAPKWKNYQCYELANSLSFNNNNSQNSVKESNLFLSIILNF